MEEEIDDNSTRTDNTNLYYWNELIPIVAVYGIGFILGLVGNGLIIFTTFCYRRMQNVTNVFLSSLASADLLLIICCFPVKVAKIFSFTWEMGFFVCKSVYYMQNVSAICSVLTLTAISIERYYAIVHPIKAKYICTISQAKHMIIIIWILSFILATPTLIAQAHITVGTHKNYYWCVKNWDWEFIWRFHELYMLFLILIFPCCVMSFCYTLICYDVWNVLERRSMMTSKYTLTRNPNSSADNDSTLLKSFIATETKPTSREQDDTHMVKQVIYMLITVVILFIVCWAPLLIENLLTAFHVLPHLHFDDFVRHMSVYFHLLAYSNSCINPIIYGFMSKSFRERFVAVLCCTSKLGAYRTNSYSLRHISRTGSQTRHTSIR